MSDSEPKPKLIQPDTVVNITETSQAPNIGQTFTGSQLEQAMISIVGNPKQNRHWVSSEGVKCQVLSPGGSWTQGTVKFVMVFTPDEPPSDQSVAQ
ncbi:hypothetical protein N836_29020 [Leptolyngbya sp. Heron Island J]|uniref:KGK domain-containing protein n=1 Tax=Leptolyngbya sp. Heron Island J TaxID=1385935 RepID=UPI0003B9BDE2|nr:KGK domain-containing protein [Leptolyngbya sp. Heron Island J]ESA38999.1 hypothetical protein N836_29020 [Leptolyngbya sp. Heron Island J]